MLQLHKPECQCYWDPDGGKTSGVERPHLHRPFSTIYLHIYCSVAKMYINKYLYPQAVAVSDGSTASPNVFFNRLIEPSHSKQL